MGASSLFENTCQDTRENNIKVIASCVSVFCVFKEGRAQPTLNCSVGYGY